MSLLLTPELLEAAYCRGIFPMADDGEIRWYSPDPRGILDLPTFHLSKRLARTVRQGRFEITVNRNFEGVIRACAGREETWINEEIIEAYTALHRLGKAHSVEAYLEGTLAGGLYGVALGGAFMGESMFTLMRDASKVCLVFLIERLKTRGYTLLDTQFITSHLQRFGAVEIPQKEYLRRLESALRLECRFD
ncbi:MAG: leucyl/phenylalanyl-tRNA--protein transferase [Nitrospirae bacterium]|nr:leucyl/phenylalanyl-tRNA--protein transferase [Candidatus Manganitrophaceae bacterium]